MMIRSRVLGAMMILALAASACNGDDSTAAGGGGTAGASGAGGTAGIGGTGTDGGGTGGLAGTDSGAGGASEAGVRDASGDVSVDALADVIPPPLTCGPFADGGADAPRVTTDGQAAPSMGFFVSSQKSTTGNLGGLVGADQRCQTLAAAVGAGSKVWHAYLSTSTVNARDRIGSGPWYNSLGALVAADLASLHARKGDPTVFLDEFGNMINGQWTGSPTPNEHDILTGSNADGTVAVGKTCEDWTSAAGPSDAGVPDGGGLGVARIGHADGFGGGCATTPNPAANQDVTSWNSAHDNGGCNDTAPRGGAGRIYCFATN